MNDITVYHERVQLPLYKFMYDVFIGDSMNKILEHIHLLYPGLQLTINKTLKMYTCTIKHSDQGTATIIILNKRYILDEEDAKNTVLRGSVNLSWHILDELDVRLGPDDYETQAYTVEEINTRVLNILNKQHDFNADIGSL